MLQHVLLLLVAPPLLALARPWNRMWRGLPLGLRRRVAHEVTGGRWSDGLRRTARFLGDPIPSWLAFSVTLAFWHIPFAYDATLRTPLVHATEHALFFGTGLLFWTRVIDSPPWRSPLPDGARAVYVASAMVAGWLLALVLAFATSPLYAPYAAEATRPGGITALADQQLAAGVMWVPGSIPFTIAIIAIVYRWLEPERAREPARRTRALAGNP
jgi:cytochrome c oxidase assembly factor CtaG